MEIMKMIGIGITGAVVALLLKQTRPEMAIVVSIATSAIVFFMLAGQLVYIFDVMDTIVDQLGINAEYIIAIIRIIGVSYLAQLGADLCRDAGQAAIATKLEIAGRVVIIALSVPVLIALMNLLLGILP